MYLLLLLFCSVNGPLMILYERDTRHNNRVTRNTVMSMLRKFDTMWTVAMICSVVKGYFVCSDLSACVGGLIMFDLAYTSHGRTSDCQSKGHGFVP